MPWSRQEELAQLINKPVYLLFLRDSLPEYDTIIFCVNVSYIQLCTGGLGMKMRNNSLRLEEL